MLFESHGIHSESHGIQCTYLIMNIPICFFIQGLLDELEETLTDLIKGRTSFEDLLAICGLEFPDDSKLIELHKKYVQIFKHPVSLTGEDLDAADDGTVNDKRPSGTDP